MVLGPLGTTVDLKAFASGLLGFVEDCLENPRHGEAFAGKSMGVQGIVQVLLQHRDPWKRGLLERALRVSNPHSVAGRPCK